MMRYSFSDFLEYQNKLNERYDEQKIEEYIDGILKRLRSHIELYPRLHEFYIYNVIDSKNNSKRVEQLTKSELSKIVNYFTAMGFTCSLPEGHDEFETAVKLKW